jgi:Family of unknown function (DUF6009)
MARSPFHPKDEPSWLAEVLAQETDIVWLHDPSRFAYVRQAAIVTRTPGGLPSDYLGGTRFIVGYGEARERVRGLCRRRIFYLRATDRDFDPLGAYRYGAPAEAVDPMTVAAGTSLPHHIRINTECPDRIIPKTSHLFAGRLLRAA